MVAPPNSLVKNSVASRTLLLKAPGPILCSWFLVLGTIIPNCSVLAVRSSFFVGKSLIVGIILFCPPVVLS